MPSNGALGKAEGRTQEEGDNKNTDRDSPMLITCNPEGSFTGYCKGKVKSLLQTGKKERGGTHKN